ncbi:hypothetical protein [Atopobium sp. oral taxon 810]|uniref:hypothetical protein n=1 Tax=Atopobium sp. oral taxon 810 TaxID=712158 RepID=UPI001E4E7A78|nr:hypothetical protein [Atopobium sp. oral taxon 810]
MHGHGDPNDENGEYKQSMPPLYGIAYAVKISKKDDHRMESYFDFVTSLLEGFDGSPE